jgi:hypothetical protein
MVAARASTSPTDHLPANNGAKVINQSLGGGGSSTLQSAMDIAWNKGSFRRALRGTAIPAAPARAIQARMPTVSRSRQPIATTTARRLPITVRGGVAAPLVDLLDLDQQRLQHDQRHVDGDAACCGSGWSAVLAGLTNAQIRQRICDTSDKISGTGSFWTCAASTRTAP